MSQTFKNTIGSFRWTICALVFFATTINYLDRQVLSLLQPILEDEFGWTNTDYANITAVFQIVYAISMLFAGRLIDKLGTKSGLSWAIIVWSLGAILHALAIPMGHAITAFMGWVGISVMSVSVVGFMAARAVLAFGESGNFPGAIKAIAEYFPKRERSLATGIFNSGANIGAILAPLTVPWIYVHWGWEAAFIAVGSIGFIWLIFWYILYERPEKQKRLSVSEFEYIHKTDEETQQTSEPDQTKTESIPLKKLVRYRQTWAFAGGKFITDGVWWFFLFWLPAYMKAQYGIVSQAVALPLIFVYTLAMVGSIAGGWLPMLFIRKGMNAYNARIRAMLIIALFPLLILAAQPLGTIHFWFPVVLIAIGASAHQAFSANLYTVVSDLLPKRAIASVIGLGGLFGGIGSVCFTKLGGALFDHYKSLGHIETGYTIMFTLSAAAYLVGWIFIKIMVPVYKPVTNL